MSASPRRSQDRNGRLLTALEHWRTFLGLGHNAFARRLGISHSYWHLIRTGDRPITAQFTQRVLVERPDLHYLLSDHRLPRAKSRTPPTVRGAAPRSRSRGAAA